MTERNRNQLQQTATASGAALLPALPSVPLGNVGPDLRRFLEAVKERLEVREGSRGNPFEAVVTKRDLASAGLLPAVMGGRALGGMSASGGLMMRRPDGSYATLSVDEFAAQIYQSPLFQSLKRSLSDPTRFDDLPSEIKNYLLNSIADEAARRGADIRNTEFKLQTELRSLAYKVEEVTASVAQAAAGVRETTYAVAEAGRATAGKITQVQARLDDVGGVTIEESMIATADRVDGLAGEYMVKINAGKAAAGFGLAASEDPTGATTSAFIVQADKFAVVTGGDVIADYNNPPANRIPFGVDANGVYINGQLRVNAGGGTLEDLATTPGPAGPAGAAGAAGQSISVVATSQVFAIDNSGTATPSSIICSVSRPPALAGSAVDGDFVWTLVSGSCSQSLTTINPSSGAFGSLSANEITTDSATFRCVYTVSTPGSAYRGMSYTDEITITKVKQGVGVSTFLTNESHTVPASTAGVVSDWTGAGGTFNVYNGTTNVTSSSTFAIVANPSSLTASIGASTGVFSVTAAGSWASASSTTTLTLRATYNHPVTGSATYDKVFTLSKSKAGAAGAAGARGGRGSLTLYASGSSWTDAVANSAILSASGSSTKVIGDTVTISNGTSFAATKYWSGTAWVSPGVVIDGNLLVSGTVSAASLATNRAVITDTLQIGADLITVPKRASDVGAVTLTSTMGSLLRLQVNYGNAATSGVHVSATVQLNAPAGATMADTELQLGVSTDGEATWGYGDIWKCKHNNTMPITFTWSQPNNFTGTVVFRIYGRRTADTGWTVTNRIMNVMATKR